MRAAFEAASHCFFGAHATRIAKAVAKEENLDENPCANGINWIADSRISLMLNILRNSVLQPGHLQEWNLEFQHATRKASNELGCLHFTDTHSSAARTSELQAN